MPKRDQESRGLGTLYTYQTWLCVQCIAKLPTQNFNEDDP